ncbi:hypothetical protein RS030_233519 [Cryptosporidium xiaoi]|uniref:Transmembrane protein n=1 Tax=Cryptosporidium xiaoi TaxID=659607 RepID=A0AAV9XX59_9CRYT
MHNSFTVLWERLKTFSTPTATQQQDKTKYVLFGVLNIILFGIGMIVIGILNNDASDIITGVLQLILPFVGWIWAIVWGVAIIYRNL